MAVQAAILPHLLALPLVPNPFRPLDDYLISAPTGSGKTLAYSIPVVKALEGRKIVRLRALIVLPTRDLVVQVRETLESFAKGTGLVVRETALVGTRADDRSALQRGNIALRRSRTNSSPSGTNCERTSARSWVSLTGRLLGGSSKVDILIATPGRLIDHLSKTQNFSLQHLRFLVGTAQSSSSLTARSSTRRTAC